MASCIGPADADPTTRPGDTVLDPFAGSGTTGEVAIELGLKAILIESSIAGREALADRLHGLNENLLANLDHDR